MKRSIFLLICACFMSLTMNGQGTKNHNLEVSKNLEIFNALYKNLDLMYVDTLDANKVITAGIDAMLHSLDRYTEYYPEARQKELKTMLTGKYAGVGALIRYHQKLKRVVVEEPYEGMPAAEAGLKKGGLFALRLVKDHVVAAVRTLTAGQLVRADVDHVAAGTVDFFTREESFPRLSIASAGRTFNYKF